MSYVAQAQAQYADAAKKNKENADAYKQSVGEIFDTQRDQVNKQAEADTQKVGSQYKGLYDEAALQQLVNERNLKQRQASLGLTDSGLTASQQTAIQVSRGNADAKISAQKQAAIDSITLQLEQYLAQIEQNRASSFAEIDYNLNNTNTNLYNTLMSQAYSNDAAVAAANAQAQATIEAARIAAAEKAANNHKSDLNSYYKYAKYLLENSGEEAAYNYLNNLYSGLNAKITDDEGVELCLALGIDETKYTTPPSNTTTPVKAYTVIPYKKKSSLMDAF